MDDATVEGRVLVGRPAARRRLRLKHEEKRVLDQIGRLHAQVDADLPGLSQATVGVTDESPALLLVDDANRRRPIVGGRFCARST